MNKKRNLIITIIGILVLICIVTILLNINNRENAYIASDNSNQESMYTDKVVINNGKIQNENLIDEFMNNVKIAKFSNDEKNYDYVELKIQTNDNIVLRYYLGSNDKTTMSENGSKAMKVASDPNNNEELCEIDGYYLLTKNGNEIAKLNSLNYYLVRKTDNDNVILCLKNWDAKNMNYTTICNYSLESSNYVQKFKINYASRNDTKVNEVYDTGEYKIKTLGGDVNVIINDKEYSLEQALKQQVITGEDILNQAKLDEQYGICTTASYFDGGSKEYKYTDYTVLKLNALKYLGDDMSKTENDLVIGMPEDTMHIYDENK